MAQTPDEKTYYVKIDAHVKSPFYMYLGIQEFRNCELL